MGLSYLVVALGTDSFLLVLDLLFELQAPAEMHCNRRFEVAAVQDLNEARVVQLPAVVRDHLLNKHRGRHSPSQIPLPPRNAEKGSSQCGT